MALSAFADKAVPPEEQALAQALGPARQSWYELLTQLASALPGLSRQWRYGGRTVGWGLRVQQGARTVLSLVPGDGCFPASLALGEQAVRAAHDRALPPIVLDAIDTAPRYAEGRGVRIAVRGVDELPAIQELALIKLGRTPA